MPPIARRNPSPRRILTDPRPLLASAGLSLLPRGRALEGECPFHEDPDRSLYVNPQTGHWNCRRCRASGETVDELIKRLESRAADARPALSLVRMNPLLSPEILRHARAAMDHYRKTLERSPEAQQYLLSLGLGHPELLSAFPIGFADGSLLEALPDARTHEGRTIRQSLVACGVLTEKNGRFHETMRGRIVFGIEDADGVLVQMCGRRPRARDTRDLVLDVPGSIFNPRALNCETLVVCADIIDALSFWVAGVRNVICVFGPDVPEDLNASMNGGVTRTVLFGPGTDGLRARLEELSA